MAKKKASRANGASIQKAPLPKTPTVSTPAPPPRQAGGASGRPSGRLLRKVGTPSKAGANGYASNSSDDEAEPAKFDVSTIPFGRLTLQDRSSESAGAGKEEAEGGPGEPAKETEILPEKDEAAEKGKEKATVKKPFPFLRLPSELRVRVYAYHFADVGRVLDLTPDNYRKIHRKLAFLRTCRHIYTEASHFFYSHHTVRIFPTFPGRFFKTRRPLLARLSANQRADLSALELRLGPGFNKPPKCWAVTPKLGLHQCTAARTLHVFVQIDPSVSWLDGFRIPGFYEAFSSALLDGILTEAPAVEVVEFDGYESVRKSSPIMQALLQTTHKHEKKVAWGPVNGWSETSDGGQPTTVDLGSIDVSIQDRLAQASVLDHMDQTEAVFAAA